MASDSFGEQPSQIPTSIGSVELRLHVDKGDPNNSYRATYEFYILDQNGVRVNPVRGGNAIPHLTPVTGIVGLTSAEFNGLQGLLDKVLVAAETTLP
jgi:hypothetical protein